MINDLQISLLGIGAVVVTGVVVFNRIQEKKYHRQLEKKFPDAQDDVLLERAAPRAASTPKAPQPQAAVQPPAAPAATGPQEPTLSVIDVPELEGAQEEPVLDTMVLEEALPEPTAPAAMPAAAQPAAATGGEWPAAADPVMDYICQVRLAAPMTAQALKDLIRRQQVFSKSVLWLGQTPAGQWVEALRAPSGDTFLALLARVQMVDRSGPLSVREMHAFSDMVQQVAAGTVSCQDIDAARQAAVALDQLCAEVDVQVGLNVLATGGEGLAGTKIRALAEASGMQLEADGTFHRLTEAGQTLYTLGNFDGTAFSNAELRQLKASGLTLLFDVPKVKDGLSVFDDMADLARRMAQQLNGELVDDNRRPLSASGLETIRAQLAAIYEKMAAAGIQPGSAGAQRLFS
jgi:FtsZ-interacting cell division protein ZipA